MKKNKKYLKDMYCYNVLILDEDKDEPTFTNEAGKFFLLENIDNKYFVFKAVLNNGEKAFALTDGNRWIKENTSFESICTIALAYAKANI